MDGTGLVANHALIFKKDDEHIFVHTVRDLEKAKSHSETTAESNVTQRVFVICDR